VCGIVGEVSSETFAASALLTRLQRLSYRGYDSYGYALPEAMRKDVGHVTILPTDGTVTGKRGIAHTRWATHGGVTVENAHPHRVGRVTLVHNGIIDNYEDLSAGPFVSETDSERLAARIDAELEEHDPLDAVRRTLAAAEGIWAIAAMIDGVEGIFVARKHVPILIGQTSTGHAIASDALAFPDASRLLALDDGAVAIVTADSVRCVDRLGRPVSMRWEENVVGSEETRPAGFAMEYEMLQMPALLSRPARSVEALQGPVTVVGCGSSVNAARLAVSLARSSARVTLASEYDPELDDARTMVAVSQSGETADVLDAVRKAKAAGRRVIAVVNAPHTTLTRLADAAVMLGAGEERCVAATKSVILQAVALARLFGADVNGDALRGAEAAIADRERIRSLSRSLAGAEHLFLIGRGAWLAIADEAALKLKEVAYQHAESVPALELKHGPLALVTEGTPVVAFGDGDDARLRSTIHEVEARGGRVTPLLFSGVQGAFRALVTAQLLAFEIARIRGTPIDCPRNLAKSVTVY